MIVWKSEIIAAEAESEGCVYIERCKKETDMATWAHAWNRTTGRRDTHEEKRGLLRH